MPTDRLCCPNCNWELLDLETPYTNHGVTITESGVRTERGFVEVPPMVRVVLVLLLEAYPRPVRYDSLIMALEELPTHRGSEMSLNSLRVRLTPVREPLSQIGITFGTTWGYGYKLELSL